jgi:tubulin alpha
MREIISLHIGQAGVQIGNAFWDLLCLEHNIDPYGYHFPSPSTTDSFSSFFSEAHKCKYVPRNIFLDLDPTPVDDIRVGHYRSLFHPEQLISGKEDASTCFARGNLTLSEEILDRTLDRIRRLADRCCSLQGFLITHSIGGGTGSGLAALLMERLAVDYSKKYKISFTVYPSQQSSMSVLEPYNATFSTHSLLEYSDVCMVMDNAAVYDICRRKLEIEKPDFRNMNQVIAQTISSITLSLRVDSALNTNISKYLTSFLPYPRLHFFITSYAPLIPPEKEFHKILSASDMTELLFTPESMLVKCNPKYGKFMHCRLMYRGDFAPKDVIAAIRSIQNNKTVNFFDWCPTGLKCEINYMPPACIKEGSLAKVEKAGCMTGNSTAIRDVFSRIGQQFDMIYSKKAFVHWFIREGMNEEEFREARENLAALEMDYREIEEEIEEENPEEMVGKI